MTWAPARDLCSAVARLWMERALVVVAENVEPTKHTEKASIHITIHDKNKKSQTNAAMLPCSDATLCWEREMLEGMPS